MQRRRLAAFFLILAGLSGSAVGENIHQAVQKGDLKTIKGLIENNPDLVESRDENGRTPLHWACRGDFYTLTKYLVDHGADVNAVDNNRVTPLQSLAARDLAKAAILLVSKNAKIDAQDYNGQTALHHAAANNAADTTEVLTSYGAALEVKDNWGRTPLLLCARERGGPELTRILLKAGADINARDKWGATPLSLSAWRGKKNVVNILLAEGADLPLRGQEARVMAERAAAHGLELLFEKLDQGGADLGIRLETGGTLVHKAAAGGSVKILRSLLNSGLRVGQRDLFGWTPLHYAVRNGRKTAAEFMIEKKADLNARTISGLSPYNIAEEFEQTELREFLAKAGAETTAPLFPVLGGDYLGLPTPGNTPQVFGLGIVSSIWGLHSSPVFSPDGDCLLWTPMVTRPGAIYSTGIIYRMQREKGRWAAPAPAPFSGEFDDDVPFFAPDGKTLYFISSRPLPGQPRTEKERIWSMDKTAGGWSEAKPLDSTLNEREMHWQFSVDRERNIYLGISSPEGYGGEDIYFSRFLEGRYLKPENLGPSVNSEQNEGTPFIAPDGGYLLFQRNLDLWICFRSKSGEWSRAQNMGAPINSPGNEICPIVSPDGKYLFFISARRGQNQAFWVDAGIIEKKRGEFQVTRQGRNKHTLPGEPLSRK